MKNVFNLDIINGIILSHELPFIINGDVVSENYEVCPVGIDEEGMVSDLLVTISILKKPTVENVNITIKVSR